MIKMPFAVWITGLPGSGKSAIAKEMIKMLNKDNIKIKYLRLDEIRKKFVKKPRYTAKERDFIYKKFVDLGLRYIEKNINVIFDATAHRIQYRNYARKKIKNFLEAYIKCPLKICIERESRRKQSLVMADLYKKALERKNKGISHKGLGKVIGVDIPYEESKDAEVVINSDKISQKKAASIIFKELLNFSVFPT